jgi:hypothetical protein
MIIHSFMGSLPKGWCVYMVGYNLVSKQYNNTWIPAIADEGDSITHLAATKM